MSEIERLTTRLKAKGTIRFHVSWGPDAHLLTLEQRARELNKMFDRVDAGDFEAVDISKWEDDRPKTNVKEWVARLNAKKVDPGDLEDISV